MEEGDHSGCSVELLACPDHREAQFSKMGTPRRSDQPAEPADDFKRMFAEMNTPEANLKFEREHQYEREVLYAGLTNLNTGFDSPLVEHFSPEEFLIVIDRCEALNVKVIGIEVFTTDVEPPYEAGLEDIEISPVPGDDWARRWVRKYMTPAITICACQVGFTMIDMSKGPCPADEAGPISWPSHELLDSHKVDTRPHYWLLLRPRQAPPFESRRRNSARSFSRSGFDSL
jgi:hypothetical protein